MLKNGIKVAIDSIDTLTKVYNFKVADWHNYYAGKKGVLVHNANYDNLLTRVNRFLDRFRTETRLGLAGLNNIDGHTLFGLVRTLGGKYTRRGNRYIFDDEFNLVQVQHGQGGQYHQFVVRSI